MTTPPSPGRVFEVPQQGWRTGRVVPCDPPATLAPGQVCFRIDRFALTSNNVTYALIGPMLGYWTFFPTAEGWGRVPVMGFADVVASAHPDVAVGTRVFGFFPMGTHLVIDAADARGASMLDAAPHRAQTALPYRQYTRTDGDPLYEASREDQHALLRGLFITSFLVDDFLADNDGFGARTLVVSSASSKTAIALGFLASRRKAQRVVGLTSARNRAFVASLGCWDAVLTYDEVGTLPADVPAAFVDHAGNKQLVAAVHERLGDQLTYSGIVGATHWERGGRNRNLPGPEPAFFFAPTQMEKRLAEWGPGGFQQRLGDAWRAFVAFSDGWLQVTHGRGPAAIEQAWGELVDGRAEPQQGHILTMWEDA